jgi:Zn-finger nucleic acid-binding protein
VIALDCPVCRAPFKETVKDGVLIDVCTQCRGIWLDRGELDKLLDIAHEKKEHKTTRWFDDKGNYPQGIKEKCNNKELI